MNPIIHTSQHIKLSLMQWKIDLKNTTQMQKDRSKLGILLRDHMKRF